jgi:uncharacterized protein (TIGR02147 family)
MSQKRPSPYDFHDFREFLKKWMEHHELQNPNFSISSFAAAANISRSLLSSILAGKRCMTTATESKLIPILGLDRTEKAFLHYLIMMSDAETQDERDSAYKSMQKFTAYRVRNMNEVETYKYMSNWYIPAIREMTALPDFMLDASWIRKRLKKKLSISKVKEALRFLQAAGYIELDDSGKVKPPTKTLHCKDGVFKLALSNYQEEIFKLATESIYNTHRDKRYITGLTIAVSEKEISKLRTALEDFIERLNDICKGTTAKEHVYHIALSTFPLTADALLARGTK